MAELIKTTDSLNDGRKKLNDAITDSNAALSTANTAKQTADLAKAESESTQTQLDTIVIEGDSSVEAAQARVNNSGTAFPTLKQRLDAEHQEVTAQLQQTEQEIDITKSNLNTAQSELDNTKARVTVQENKKISQNDVSQEFLEQFVQNTQEINAIPADYSLRQRQFREPIVVGIPSKNLFNLKDSFQGYYVGHSTGNQAASPNYTASNYIPIEPSTNYVRSGTTVQLAFFDEEKNHIGGHPNGFTGVFETPLNARFIRISMLNTEVDKVQLEKGSTASPYETFDPKISKSLLNFDIEGVKKVKSILFLGDSITAKEERWVTQFNSIVQPQSYINVSVSGAHWKDYGATDFPYDGNPSGGANQHNNVMGNQVQKVLNENYTEPDIIIMFAGTNDNMNHENVTVESQFTTEGTYIPLEDANRMVFAGAMRWSIETLRNKYPNAQIFVVTQIQGNEELRPYAVQKQKVDIIKETANRLSVPVVNAFDESGIYGAFENNGTNGRYLIDGLHPNENGGIKLGSYIAKQILNSYAE